MVEVPVRCTVCPPATVPWALTPALGEPLCASKDGLCTPLSLHDYFVYSRLLPLTTRKPFREGMALHLFCNTKTSRTPQRELAIR